METSDEWLAIGGGIGTIVLLFAIFAKSNGKGPYQASSPNESYAAPSETTQELPAPEPSSSFSPAPEDINIGGTTIGGNTINMGSNLFPFFGYAVQSNGLQSAYRAINNLMNNNAQYQNRQFQESNQYNQLAAQTADYQANATRHQGK